MTDLFQIYVDLALHRNEPPEKDGTAWTGGKTLGWLIDAIEEGIKNDKDRNEENPTEIRFDFPAAPEDIDSYRGFYDHLAIGIDSESKYTSAVDFLSTLKEAVGKTFTGYKGGDYTMNRNTPLWIDDYGDCSSCAVIGLYDTTFGYLIILTGYIET